jgi:predicted DNA-binding transcriptional regulator AlpA
MQDDTGRDIDTDELLTDPEGAKLLKVGPTRFAEIQREPGFPQPVWLGPRGKRHVRSELLRYALSRRGPAAKAKGDKRSTVGTTSTESAA